jgi:uncharacterized membrane protein YgdD (TMEM256/DUF423 family)
MDRFFFVMGCISPLIVVAGGAFRAQVPRGKLTPGGLNTLEVAVRYQLYYALALIAVAWAINHWPDANAAIAGLLFLAGTVLFSGSLYPLTLTGVRGFGIVTLAGGVLFIAGWVCLAWMKLQVGR